jgi:molybdopterin/thiamine biosynthesis adenylyltransferase
MDEQVLPKLKHMTPVFPVDGTLYVGGYGQVAEIPDEDGAIGRLFELLDGTRTIGQVHRDLAADFPHVTVEEVAAAIEQFDEAGFLLDEGASAEGLLDEYELGRWGRNVNFFGSYSRLADNKFRRQRRLLDAHVTLLGLGGLGCHLLQDLAALGVGHVRVVEFDRVELSNLNRQVLYRDGDIGQPKIDLAVERIQAFNPRMEIEKIPRRLGSTEDVLAAVDGADLVISVADRPKMEINHWVNEACVRADVPLVTGGLDTQRLVYFTMIPGVTGCIECWRLGVFRTDDVSAALLAEKRERQIGGDNAAFVPLVTMTTGLLLGEAVRLLTGIAPPVAAGKLVQVRFDDYETSVHETWDRLPDCPVCGQPAVPASDHSAAASGR